MHDLRPGIVGVAFDRSDAPVKMIWWPPLFQIYGTILS
jgi:hypothetical protein